VRRFPFKGTKGSVEEKRQNEMHPKPLAPKTCSNFFYFCTLKLMKMEDWELDYEWLRVRHYIKDSMQRPNLPDLDAILFLIGIQELGRWEDKFTKEEKQDLIHIAVCQLLSSDGYFEFEGRDADGWPHYKELRPIGVEGVEGQGRLLKIKVIDYFKEMQDKDSEEE